MAIFSVVRYEAASDEPRWFPSCYGFDVFVFELCSSYVVFSLVRSRVSKARGLVLFLAKLPPPGLPSP